MSQAPNYGPNGTDGMRRVRLSEWARDQGIARITAYRMLQRGILPVPAERSPTGRWYVVLPDARAERMAFYTRATRSPDQALEFNNQIAILSEWAASRRQQAFVVIKEVASPFTDHLPRLAQLLADPQITEIVVESPSVIGDTLFQIVVAALAPQGRVITAATQADHQRSRKRDAQTAILNLCMQLHGRDKGRIAARRALEAPA